jgi:osmoprotectant transport system ATP-binding protein
LRQSAEHFRKFNGDDDRALERTDQGKRCDRRVRTAGLSMTEARTAIAFHDVSKSYGSASPVLDRVSLEVREREFLAVVGPSGSGKTTLLRLVNRLIEPSSGTVRVEGRDVREQDAVGLRRRIGYVFQGVGLFPHMTVAENIAITPKLLGMNRQLVTVLVDELLELVRLGRSEHRERYPLQLSGGEAQRVGVARALAAKPKIMLMDEPFGALDPLTREALGRDYRRLHNELGLTTVMITHDTVEALLLADRIAVMRAGRVIAEDTPRALLGGEQDEYVRELMATPRNQAERLRALMEG